MTNAAEKLRRDLDAGRAMDRVRARCANRNLYRRSLTAGRDRRAADDVAQLAGAGRDFAGRPDARLHRARSRVEHGHLGARPAVAGRDSHRRTTANLRAGRFSRRHFSENNPALSPDGRWLAYQSNESGRFEIYVRSFPDCGPGASGVDRRRLESDVVVER